MLHRILHIYIIFNVSVFQVVQGNVIVGLLVEAKAPLVLLVIQDIQGYLELKDIKGTQGSKD